MANTFWRNERVRCPYYVSSSERSVLCQIGPAEGKARRILPDRHKCTEYFRRNCAANYRSCPMYRMISEMLETKRG